METQGWPNSKSKPVNGGSEDGDGKDVGGIVVVIVTGKITGIIVNDYRNNHQRRCPTKGSSAPIQKEGTGPKSCQRRRTRPQSKRRDRPQGDDGVMVL